MNRRPHGFTLVELVVVILLMGIVASIGATMVTSAVSGQQANRGRLVLAQSVDGTLTRIADEVRRALPNSVRVATEGTAVWVEWIPVKDVGRYRTGLTDSGAGDPLSPDRPVEGGYDNSFDVIGFMPQVAAQDALVFHNLGLGEADAYSLNNLRKVAQVGSSGLVFHKSTLPLPGYSSAARFFVVDKPVSLACLPKGDHFELRRFANYNHYTAATQQPRDAQSLRAIPGVNETLLISRLASCEALYSAELGNLGVLTLNLQVSDDSGTSMKFMQQVAVDNSP